MSVFHGETNIFSGPEGKINMKNFTILRINKWSSRQSLRITQYFNFPENIKKYFYSFQTNPLVTINLCASLTSTKLQLKTCMKINFHKQSDGKILKRVG